MCGWSWVGTIDVSACGSIWLRVKAHWNDIVCFAAIKSSIIVSWHVPMATLDVIDMLTERGRIWAVLAHANAVLSVTHEVGPFVDLLAQSGSAIPDIGENETSVRVPETVSSVRVQLSSSVTGLNIGVYEVPSTRHLDVIRSLNKMGRNESPSGEQTSPTSRGSAPCHHNFFDDSDSRVRLWGPPETEILDTVHIQILAFTGLIVASSTSIRPSLALLSCWRKIAGVICCGVLRFGSHKPCNNCQEGTTSKAHFS